MTFTIRLTIEDTLTVEQIWPDGDAPDNPTCDNVYDLLDRSGSPLSVANEWNLTVHDWEVSPT